MSSRRVQKRAGLSWGDSCRISFSGQIWWVNFLRRGGGGGAKMGHFLIEMADFPVKFGDFLSKFGDGLVRFGGFQAIFSPNWQIF